MKDKVVLITGAAKRVGATIAKHLHEQGARIIIHYGSSEKAASELVAELDHIRPGSAVKVQADLNDQPAINHMVKEAMQAWDQLDVLINNASSFYPTPMGSATSDDWNKLFNTNAKAPFFLSQSFMPHLKKSQGCIINMVDVHAERPMKDHPVYCMAKAALQMMTKSLAKDLAPDVRVNGIAPGMILWPDDEMPEKTKDYIVKQVPMKKVGTPEHIAEAISFLIQQDYITGQILAVDGGRLLNI